MDAGARQPDGLCVKAMSTGTMPTKKQKTDTGHNVDTNADADVSNAGTTQSGILRRRKQVDPSYNERRCKKHYNADEKAGKGIYGNVCGECGDNCARINFSRINSPTYSLLHIISQDTKFYH